MPIRLGTNRISRLIVGVLSQPWTPADITTAFWLDATDASTLTLSGTDVTAWADKSGNSNDFTPPSALYASYDATGLNGMPAVVWPTSTNTIRYLTSNTFALAEFAFIGSYQDGTPTTWGYNFAGVVTSGGGDTSLIGNLTGTDKFYGVSSYYSGSRDGVVSDYRTTSAALPINTTFFSLHRPTGALTSTWQIGNDRTNANRGWQGPFGEFIGTATKWDDATRQKVEGYLAWKWGVEANLPVGHPYKDSRPTV